MLINRRAFGKGIVCSSTAGWLLLSSARLARSEQEVALQPFAAQVARLLTALQAIGEPFSAEEANSIQAATSSKDESVAIGIISSVLDRHVLMEVTINPEARVSVARGSAKATLVQGGWRTFLVKVRNQAAVTSGLVFHSPQGGPMGRRSSLAITGVHDFTNGAVDAVEAQARWIGLAPYDQAPLSPALSGLSVEYRLLQLYSRDAGNREATLQADLGLGEQDLGFRSQLPILFDCLPAQQISLSILDEHARPCMASLLIKDSMGRLYPIQGKRGAPDLAFEPQIYRADGETLLLPDGRYTITVGRGPEYVQQTSTLVIAQNVSRFAVKLERWIEPAKYGYYSGDTHVHAAGCSHYESPTEGVTPEVVFRQVAGEALDLGAVLNWGPGFDYQKQFFSAHTYSETASSLPDQQHHRHDAENVSHKENSSASSSEIGNPILRYDVEVSGFPSSHSGHLILLRLQQDWYPNARSIDNWPSWNLPILKWAKAQGAITGYAHVGHGMVVDDLALPNYAIPPFNSSGANEYLVDVTHPGMIDFISGCDLWPFAELNVWYHTLNCGYLTPFAGETDFPCLTDECVGGGRSYVRVPNGLPRGDQGYDAWLQALLSRDSYFGDGRSHIFSLQVRNDTEGVAALTDRDLHLSAPSHVEVTAQVCARLELSPDDHLRKIHSSSPYVKPYWHLERARLSASRRVPVELIVNGYPVSRSEVLADGTVQAVRFQCQIERSSWIALRIYPSAHTNPLAIYVGGKDIRASKRSAQWCREAVDACWAQKRLRIRPVEQEGAGKAYDHARGRYEAIISECLAN